METVWEEQGTQILIEVEGYGQKATIRNADGTETQAHCAGLLFQEWSDGLGAIWCEIDQQPPMLDEVLMEEAPYWRALELNPKAALQKTISAHNFWPVGVEFDVEYQGQMYRAQQAEHPYSGSMRIYYAKVGDWGDVRWAG